MSLSVGARMILITGPQATSEQCRQLDEMSGLLGAERADSDGVDWSTATAMYALHGWEGCPAASADIAIAGCAGLPIIEFPEPP